MTELKSSVAALEKKVAESNRVPPVIPYQGTPLLGGYGIMVPPGRLVCGKFSVAEVERFRTCVIRKNLDDVQNGRKIVLPNIDPQTNCFKKGEPLFKAIDRQVVEAMGIPSATRFAQPDKPTQCQTFRPPVDSCAKPHPRDNHFAIVIR